MFYKGCHVVLYFKTVIRRRHARAVSQLFGGVYLFWDIRKQFSNCHIQAERKGRFFIYLCSPTRPLLFHRVCVRVWVLCTYRDVSVARNERRDAVEEVNSIQLVFWVWFLVVEVERRNGDNFILEKFVQRWSFRINISVGFKNEFEAEMASVRGLKSLNLLDFLLEKLKHYCNMNS